MNAKYIKFVKGNKNQNANILFCEESEINSLFYKNPQNVKLDSVGTRQSS